MNKELFKQIEILNTCLEEAPIDFLGTSSDGKGARREEKAWLKTSNDAYRKAIELVNDIHPHEWYMEFAEWCRYNTGYDKGTTPDLFNYWITNVKKKQ